MPYLLLAQTPGSDIITNTLSNPEKITFAVIAFVALAILVVVLVVGYKVFTTQGQMIKDLLEINRRTENRHDKVVSTLDVISSTQEKVASTLTDGMDVVKKIPDLVVGPVVQAVSDALPSLVQSELGTLQKIISENPLHIGVMSIGPTGRIVAINQDALRLFGWKNTEILGRFIFATDLNVIGPDQQRVAPPQYVSSLCFYTRQPVNNRLLGVYNKEKQNWAWVIVNAEPSFNPTTGKLERILTSFVEAGRVIPFDPKADYALSLADTQEVATIKDAEA